MLVLRRKPGESIQIGEDVRVTLLDDRGRIGIEAPQGIRIQRDELLDRAAPVAAAAGERGGGKDFGAVAAPTSLEADRPVKSEAA